MEESDAIRILAALAHPLRLQVFRALVMAGANGMTPGVMSEGAGVPAASLSFHLKELMNSGLITQVRQSRNLVYRASFERTRALVAYLTDNCCGNQKCC